MKEKRKPAENKQKNLPKILTKRQKNTTVVFPVPAPMKFAIVFVDDGN